MKKLLSCIFLSLAYCGEAQFCNPILLTSGPNAFGTGGDIPTYRQNCLSYNPDLNSVLWIHRSNPSWQFPGYNSGSVQATWMNVSTGVKDSSIIFYDSANTTSNPARYPGGVFYNPVGNASISNAYVVSSGPDLIGGTAFNGVWYATRKLTGTSADQQLPLSDHNYTPSPSSQFGSAMFLNYDMQQVGNKVLVGGELKDTTTSPNGSFNAVFGGVIGKCDFSSGNPIWTYDSIVPGYYFNWSGSGNGYASDGSGGRIAFDPSGTIGYWVGQGRLATNFNNSADSMLAPIVYKTTNGGATWLPVLQGYDWSSKHPELRKNVGLVYNSNGVRHFKINPKHGYDVTVDSAGTLHLVASLTGVYQDGAQVDSLSFSYTYDYDYTNYHPIIWDLMTDGTTWNTLMVDSIITSFMGMDPASDTTAAYGSWTNSATFLAYGSRIQVSRSSTGGKIFYSWADSDPAITGNQFNGSPDLYLKSYDMSHQKVTSTINFTNGIGVCYFHYIADVSYFDSGSGKWVCPMVYTTGTPMSPGMYNGTSAVDYNYLGCGSFTNAQYTNVPIINTASSACSPSVTFVMHQDSANPQPGVWEISSYYSPQVTSAVWYWGDGTSTAGLAPTHTYAGPGQYTICVTVFSSCGDSANVCQNDSLYRMYQNNNPNSMVSVTVLNENGVGIKTNTKQTAQLSVYPNPSEGRMTLQMNEVSSSIAWVEISITNVLGGVIYSSKEKVENNSMNKAIDLKDVSDGAYFMKVRVGDKIYTNKIIIGW